MLHQIFYKPEHLPKLFPFAVPHFNEKLTIFFENTPIQKVVSTATTKNVAVCSWRLVDKLPKRVGLRRPLTEEALNEDFEVLSFTRNSSRHTMLAMLHHWHPGAIPALDLLWQKLGMKRPGEAKNPIYQNHFSSRLDIYQDYVTNFLTPAIELITHDPELNKMMIQLTDYGKLSKKADLKSVKEQLGLDEYPLCPFVLERCFSLWAQMKKVNITYL